MKNNILDNCHNTRKYSVLITNGANHGSGLLFYPGGNSFYVFTCKHVIDGMNTEEFELHIPTPVCPDKNEYKETIVKVSKKQVVFPENKNHDYSVITIRNARRYNINRTEYYIVEAVNDKKVYFQGYPGGKTDKNLIYSQDRDFGFVLNNIPSEHYFQIRATTPHMDNFDRTKELKGMSGAPIWLDNDKELCVLGLLSEGKGENADRAILHAEKISNINTLMKEKFNIIIEDNPYCDYINTKDPLPLQEKEKSVNDVITIILKKEVKRKFLKEPDVNIVVANKKDLMSGVLKWINNGKNSNVNVDIQLQELNKGSIKQEKIGRKIVSLKHLSRKGIGDFTNYTKEKQYFESIKNKKINVCQLFLRDSTNQAYFGITNPEDYIYILSQIATNDSTDYHRYRLSQEYITIHFIQKRDNGEEFSFISPIKKESLPAQFINNMLKEHNFHIRDMAFDIEISRMLLAQFYKKLSIKACNNNDELLEDKNVMDLESYILGWDG